MPRAGGAAAAACRSCADVASDLQDKACRPTSTSTATPPGGFGITAAAIDNALYDAFGQRLVSTIFTQSNQYRVVLEVEPGVAARARTRIDEHLCAAPPAAGRCR